MNCRPSGYESLVGTKTLKLQAGNELKIRAFVKIKVKSVTESVRGKLI